MCQSDAEPLSCAVRSKWGSRWGIVVAEMLDATDHVRDRAAGRMIMAPAMSYDFAFDRVFLHNFSKACKDRNRFTYKYEDHV